MKGLKSAMGLLQQNLTKSQAAQKECLIAIAVIGLFGEERWVGTGIALEQNIQNAGAF